MDKCECIGPGFCNFFKQEMTYDPPNWQWCQSATEEERKKYKREYMREYNKKYYHENPEKVKGWRDKRIERRRETERAWRAKNRERLNARKREQYLKKKLENVDKE